MRALVFWIFASFMATGLAGAADLDAARQLHGSGDLDAALAAYHDVVESSAADADKATALNNSCVIWMNRGHYVQARDACETARRIRSELGDERRLARTLNNLGITLEHTGRYADANEAYHGALEINTRLGDLAAQSTNHANLGALATRTGQYGSAIGHHGESLAIAKARRDEPWASGQISLAHINRGVVFERLGLFREALAEYRQVAASDLETDAQRQAALSVNMGVVYRNLGDPVRALAFYEKAITELTRQQNSGALSNAWLNVALVQARDLEDPRAAEDAFTKAISLAEQSGDNAELIEALFYFGQFLSGQSRDDEAQMVFQRALELAEDAGSSEGLWSAYAGLGRIALRNRDTTAAVDYANRALGVLESVRGELSESRWRTGFFGDKRAVYELAVSASLESGDDEDRLKDALTIVQRAKSRELVETLGAAADTGRFELHALQSALVDAILLEYYVANGQLHVWIVDRESVQHYSPGEFDPVGAASLRVHDKLSTGGSPDATDLELLSGSLLPPALSFRYKRIRIATDDVLGYLPFEILNVDNERQLAGLAVISYLPSGSALPALKSRIAAGSRSLVSFGDVVFSDIEDSTYARRFRLSALPKSGQEIDGISKFVPGAIETYRGIDATESNFRQAAQAGSRIFHFATHAVASDRQGDGTALVLTPKDGDDGLMFPSEIADMEIRSSLAVLSACRTAPGKTGNVSALTSLTGAFLAAGSKSVLATLWDVDDAATAAFMEQFYFFLGQNLRPDDALARTKKAFRENPDWSDPALWSPYVLIGESGPVLERTGGRTRATALGVGSVLLVFLVLVLLRRARN